jgi:predicted MFS family arabinose efflux permease
VPYLAQWIVFIIDWAAVPVGVFAVVHALVHKAEAYEATGKLSKQAWVGITIGGTLAVWLFSFYKATTMLWIAGLVAVLVYLVDVRPKLNEVQRGKKW